jgi:regulator of nucleoside diphosphate kinase
MSTHVIPAGDNHRILDFLNSYRPALQMEAGRIEILRSKLERAEIVPDTELSRHVVSMYSTVRLADMRDRLLRNYTLVYPYNAAGGPGHVSLLSPLGTALLGCRAGETIICEVHGEPRSFSIREVLYQPEWDERNRLRSARLASPR